jgi:23S rRNA (adenine2503-C2)-methyltransferase
MERMNIFGKSLAQLEAEFTAGGLERYRAKQVFYWLYNQGVETFDEMTNLSKGLRAKLAETFSIQHPVVVKEQRSGDGTRKFLLALEDGARIETVLIRSESEDADLPKRLTLCVSTQVGCPLGCVFCATATMKRRRNLSAGEIAGQYLVLRKLVEQRITNLVYMGMGEPLLNYDATMQSIDLITDDVTCGIGASHITVSTAGMVDGIRRMADEGRKAKLAISLHSVSDTTRSSLMPINRKHDLGELIEAIEYYARLTGRRVTYEYIMFEGLNDTPADATRLARFALRVPSKVNLIPFHSIEAAGPKDDARALRPASRARIDAFADALRNRHVTVMLRASAGKDIDAACGQLAVSSDRKH